MVTIFKEGMGMLYVLWLMISTLILVIGLTGVFSKDRTTNIYGWIIVVGVVLLNVIVWLIL